MLKESWVGCGLGSEGAVGGGEEKRRMQRAGEEGRARREGGSGPVFNWIPRRVIPSSASLAVESGGRMGKGRKEDTFKSSLYVRHTCKHARLHRNNSAQTFWCTYELVPTCLLPPNKAFFRLL